MQILYRIFVMVTIFFWISPSLAEDGYRSYSQMTATVEKLERAYPSLVHLESIGKTNEGRDLWIIRLTNEKVGNPLQKPGLFLVANLEGNHLVGSEMVLCTAENLLSRYGQDSTVTSLLDDHSCYLMPRANPDAAETYFSKVRTERLVNFTPFDDDHDGLLDEDPSEDLNGDGLITLMRVRTPEGRSYPDPSDNRLLKKADPANGERGVFRVYSEGIDNDGDGTFNEDGQGGVNINRNFPHHYPNFQADAGMYMTSEPETRAIIDFLFAHRNIGIVLSYSHHDNLIQTPKPERPKPGAEASSTEGARDRFRFDRKPEMTIHKNDLPYFETMGKAYRETIGHTASRQTHKSGSVQGSFHEWAYFQYGVLAGTTPVWNRPSPESQQDTVSDKTSKKQPGANKAESSPDLEWIRWIDTERQGVGFVEWQSFDHPNLGEVEIGGFAPYVRSNPPEEMLTALAQQHSEFFIGLSALLPRLVLHEVTVQREADQLYRIEATVRNEGPLPTALNHGVKARAVKPVLIKLEGNDFEMMAGKRLILLDTIAGSGTAKKWTWVVKAKKGAVIELSVASEKGGQLRKRLELR